MKALYEVVVKRKRFAVKTSGKLLKQLIKYSLQFETAGLSKSTLAGCFTFAGGATGIAAAAPVPNTKFLNSISDGHTIGFYASTGASQQRYMKSRCSSSRTSCWGPRETGFSVNIPGMRALFIGILVNNGQKGQLSPTSLIATLP